MKTPIPNPTTPASSLLSTYEYIYKFKKTNQRTEE